MNPIDALERELVRAARRRRRRSRIPRRVAALAATLGVLGVAIPVAVATKIVSNVFPRAHDTPHALGRGYVVASGTTARGEHWSFQLTRGAHFRDGSRAALGWALLVGGRGGAGIALGGRGPAPDPRVGGTVGYMRPVSSRDPRTIYLADVPRSVALVRLTFRSGKTVRVRPLRVDQARARATGVPYRYSFVAIAYPSYDTPLGVSYEDAHGRDATPRRGMIFPRHRARHDSSGPVVQSPAL
jgi:hypothetical protein